MTLLRKAFFLVALSCVPLMQAQTVVEATNLTFTTIDVPGAGFTGVEGINTTGDMVGCYGKTYNGPFRSFLFRGGNFKFFSYPGAHSTLATGINDSGLIVGYTGGVLEHGFLYDGTTFTSVRDGGKSATISIGINNGGQVVGGDGTIYTTRGFELRNRHFKDISPPGTFVYIYATGINDLGEIVGWDDTGGFSYTQGVFQNIDFPGANVTEALGINNSGLIVGWYLLGGSAFGFAVINGQYTSFSYPGAKGTLPRAINAAGQVVGEYTYDFITYHGFVTSPITTGIQ